MISNKYKTAMCKHFEQTGQCHIGAKCHFAHGEEELRSINDPIPPGVTSINSGPKQFKQGPRPSTGSTASGSGNFKTAMCKYFEKGSCKYGQSCSFAHGDTDLRSGGSTPTSRPQKYNKMPNMMQQQLYDPSLQNYITQKQLQNLGYRMESHHANDKELLTQIRKANEICSGGDIHSSATILYGIMNRQEKSKEDVESYSAFTYEMQEIGNTLLQQYQQVQYAQMSMNPMVGMSGMAPNPMGNYGQYGGGYNGHNNYKPTYGNKGYPKNHGNRNHYGNRNQGNQNGEPISDDQ